MCFAKKKIGSGRATGPIRSRRRASLLLLVIAVLSAALVPLSLLLVLMRDLPGDIDALLLSCSRCSPEEVEECDGDDGSSRGVCVDGNRVEGIGRWREKIVWSFIRRTFVPHCERKSSVGDSPKGGPNNMPSCAPEEERLRRLCAEYREVRSNIRMDQLVLGPAWWYRCKLHAFNISLAPQSGIFVKRSIPDQVGSKFWPGTRDVLRFDVVDSTLSLPDCMTPPPPPAVEIGEVRMEWRSWMYPVVDIHVSDVTFNVVIGTNKSGTLGMPLPFVAVGTTPVDEALEMIPDPPEEEGTYPRIGIVNVTNVSVLFHTAPVRSLATNDHIETTSQTEIQPLNCSEVELDDLLEKKKRIQFAKVDVPSDYFEALLDATAVASPVGIDQYYFNSVVESAIKSVTRNQLLREDDLRDFLEHLVEMSHMVKRESIGKLNDGVHFVDAFVMDGRVALDRWWKDLQHEWKERNDQMGNALHKLEGKWGHFLHSIHFESPKLDKYVDDLSKSLKEFKTKRADWKLVFPKIADEWKKGWTEMEQNWAKKVAPHFDNIVAEVKDEVRKLQVVFKEKIEHAKSNKH